MQILVPRENEKASLAAEQMFASIHGILENYTKCPDVVSFEIASNQKSMGYVSMLSLHSISQGS
jgi:hypothetical protein